MLVERVSKTITGPLRYKSERQQMSSQQMVKNSSY